MGTKPDRVEIRAYNVGFGDCFLLSFVYGAGDARHVLIDFGTGQLPKGVRASDRMPLIADDIRRVTGGSLTAVVVTHRHADHISGFGTDEGTGKSGNIIRGLKPEIVLQPWTEDPDAAEDARTATRESNRSPKSFTAGLREIQGFAEDVYALSESKPVWMGAALQRELSFFGMENIKNESAVRNLAAMGDADGARSVWAHHGSSSGLESRLPGVSVRVLGPPDLRQTEGIRKMRKTDPDEFWHLLAGTLSPGMDGRVRGRSSHRVPSEARWFRDQLDRMRGTQLLQIVRVLDEYMNNTSLILLFEVGGKKLLFPGDAQIENWSYALSEAPDAEETRKSLAGVDVYKVGHHGSLNATPKTLLWRNFDKRNAPRAERLRALLSTMHGNKHGKTANKTEIPRRTLLEALEKETLLSNTDDLGFGSGSDLCHLLVL
jgi:hypothetical protein